MEKKHINLIVIGLGIAVVSYYFYNKQNQPPPSPPTLGNLFSQPLTGSLSGDFMQGWDSTINSIFGTSYGQ
jgi:hypothetical protein